MYRYVICFMIAIAVSSLFSIDMSVDHNLYAQPSQSSPLPPLLVIKTLAAYPHDKYAFTQGLEFHDGILYEGTGNYGRSKLRKVERKTGKVQQEVSLPRQYFGEGITIFEGKIYQLTWRENTCFVYDLTTFRREKSLQYSGEGWGLTNDGKHLIMSNGTANLQFYDPKTFQLLKTVAVRDGEKSVELLNELEYVRGEIWANVWGSTRIVRITPETGKVIGWINCANFVPKDITQNDIDKVLNGIAFDAATNRVYITGKNWSLLYELQIEESPESQPPETKQTQEE